MNRTCMLGDLKKNMYHDRERMTVPPFSNLKKLSGFSIQYLNEEGPWGTWNIVLFADKVSCPMTQHYDSGDSQISNPSISSLTLYELSHCASKVHYLCKYDVVGGRASFV